MDSCSKEDYSRHIREALMVVEKLSEVNPPSDRVSGQVQAVPILESSWQWSRGEYREKKRLSRFSVKGGINRPKGGTRGVPTSQAPSRRDQRRAAPRGCLGGGWPSFGIR